MLFISYQLLLGSLTHQSYLYDKVLNILQTLANNFQYQNVFLWNAFLSLLNKTITMQNQEIELVQRFFSSVFDSLTPSVVREWEKYVSC